MRGYAPHYTLQDYFTHIMVEMGPSVLAGLGDQSPTPARSLSD
jgi:hypothetical protein